MQTLTNETNIEKKKIPKRPDFKQQKIQIQKLNEQITSKTIELEKIKTKLSLKSGTEVERNKREILKKELSDIRSLQLGNRKLKSSLLTELKDLNEKLKLKQSEVKSVERKFNIKTIDELEIKIKNLEEKIETGKLSLVEEKKIFNEIRALNKSRSSIKEMDNVHKDINSYREQIKLIKTKLNEINPQDLSSQYDKTQEKINILDNSKLKKEFDELIGIKNRIQNELNEIYKKKKDLNERFNKQLEAYEIYIEEVKIQKEKSEQLKIEKDKENEFGKLIQKEIKMAKQPAFKEEILHCNILLKHFGKNDISVTETFFNKKVNTKQFNIRKPVEIESNLVPIKKEDFENTFSPKLKTKKNKGKKDNLNLIEGQLKIPLDIVESLSFLNIDIPTNLLQVDNVINIVSDKKNWFIQNQENVTNENIKKAEEKIQKMKLDKLNN